jgi:hypothetical protein
MRRRRGVELTCLAYPPLEGEGRFAWSEAKCETGWGDLSTRAPRQWRDCHPTPYRTALRAMRYDPPPPGEGKRKSSHPTRDSNFKQRKDMRPHSRGALRPSFASIVTPRKQEGAGKAGCALHPRSRVQLLLAENAHEHTGSAEAVRPSLRNGFTAYNALSSVSRTLLPPSLRRSLRQAWRQRRAPERHVFTVRSSHARQSQLSRPPHLTARS